MRKWSQHTEELPERRIRAVKRDVNSGWGGMFCFLRYKRFDYIYRMQGVTEKRKGISREIYF